MKLYPSVTFRPFVKEDGLRVVKWLHSLKYQNFTRHFAYYPSFEDCFNYPAWSQNYVMMITDSHDPNKVIGMAIAYQSDRRNSTIKLGILVDEAYQKQNYGHSAFVGWTDWVFKMFGFRKIIIEITDHEYIEPLKRVGFQVEGVFNRECKVDNQWVDEIRMCCFDENWRGIENYGDEKSGYAPTAGHA